MGQGNYDQARLDLTRLQKEYPNSKDVLLQLGLLALLLHPQSRSYRRTWFK